MNRGLVEKYIRSALPAALGFGLAIFAIEALLATVLPAIRGELEGTLLRLEFVSRLFAALLGTEAAGGFGPRAFDALPWVHPAVLSLFWAAEITWTTRTPAGEIDRGTIDITLGLPVTRLEIWTATTAAWLVEGVILVASALAGQWIGGVWIRGGELFSGARLAAILVNLYCLWIAVGAIGLLASAASERRGRAVAVVVAVVLVSFLWNFIAALWEPARSFRWIGLLDYYQPLQILETKSFPVADCVTLVAVGLVAWAAGAALFARRDVHTL